VVRDLEEYNHADKILDRADRFIEKSGRSCNNLNQGCVSPPPQTKKQPKNVQKTK
jgi:hypothetical protein